MLKRHGCTTIIAFLLVLTSLCAPVMAGQVGGVTVDVSNEQGKFVGDNIVDGDPATAWVGGGKGIGPGKYIELYFESPVTLESMRIRNGHQGKGQFDRFRRVVRGVILYPDETRQKFILKPSSGVQAVKLQPKTVASFKIIITGVAPSSRDKNMGKAKVAVSEIVVFGSVCEGDDCAAVQETLADKPPATQPAEMIVGKKSKHAQASKVAPVTKEDVPVKPESVKKTVPKKVSDNKVESSEKAASVKPTAPKKVASKKTPRKKAVSKKAAKKKNTPKKATITYLRPASRVPADKDFAVGVIDPWLDLELVALMKRYFALLTTLHDSYPDLFVSGIRDRERKVFISLQNDMRAKLEFNQHSIAMLEHIGLNFDKPEANGGVTTVRVHGPYRYYLGNDAFEYQVDTVFSLKKENGAWRIAGVRDK